MEPELLISPSTIQPSRLSGIESFLARKPVTATGFRKLVEDFQSQIGDGPLKQLCEIFRGASMQGDDVIPLLAVAFKNMTTVIHNSIPAHIVVGSVRGLKVKGLVRVGPGMVLAAP